jgi:two-component system chemotaxis response regulator CheY
LVCDDSILVRKKLVDALRKLGVTEISEAKDGIQAVDMYKELKPDVVFMDIVMPEMTGVEALKMIKVSAPEAKIIMATSIGTEGNLSEAIKYGASDFLQKPVDEEQLRKLLDNYFKEA